MRCACHVKGHVPMSYVICGTCDRINAFKQLLEQCNTIFQCIKRKFTVELTPTSCTLILHCRAINFVMVMLDDVRSLHARQRIDRARLLCLKPFPAIHSFAYGVAIVLVRMRPLQRSHTYSRVSNELFIE